MKLHEIADSNGDVEKAVEEFCRVTARPTAKFHVQPDGRVDISGSLVCTGQSLRDRLSRGKSHANIAVNGRFPFPIGTIDGQLVINDQTGITTLDDWFPQVAGTVGLIKIPLHDLSSLPGDQTCQKYVFVDMTLNLTGIHKRIPQARLIMFDNCNITKNVLGLCLIGGLTKLNDQTAADCRNMINVIHDGVQHMDTVSGKKLTSTEAALYVVGKYIGAGRPGVLAAQQELLDLGLDDYAHL